MAIEIIRWEHLVATRWKNGGGTAVDITTASAVTAPDGFDWRINVATITRSGPFSHYPDIDRDLRVLEGGPVELLVDGCSPRTLAAGQSGYRFAGDVPTFARLIGEQCRVFNVLTRRNTYESQVRDLDVTRPATIAPAGNVLVGLVRAGSASVLVGSEPQQLGPLDSFVTDELVQLGTETGGRLILVELATTR